MHRKTVMPSQKEAALLQGLLTQTLLIFFPNYHFKGRAFFFFARKDRMRWKLSLEDSTTKQLMEASCLLGLAHGITTSTATTSSLPKSLRVGLPACQITIFHVFYFSFLKANHLSAPGCHAYIPSSCSAETSEPPDSSTALCWESPCCCNPTGLGFKEGQNRTPQKSSKSQQNYQAP